VEGILGECGGQAMCATCHVYVDAKDLENLPEMSDDEDAMLEDTASERKSNSRLSCQIDASDELDGIVVYLPDEQSL
jgi:2Fe-2S ferredoxin